MKILFLAQLLPLPLDAGPKTRAYYVLRYLVAAGHDVTLLCFVRPGDRASDVRELRSICASVETVELTRHPAADVWYGVRSLVSNTPFLVLRDQRRAMRARVRHLLGLGQFDALHIDQLWMAPYARAASVTLKVLDQHNAVFRVPRQLAAQVRNPLARAVLRVEAAKLEQFEQTTLAGFDRVVWVNQEDLSCFHRSGDGARPSHDVIPIAIDPRERRPHERSRPFRVVFLGGLHWPPNAEAVDWFSMRVWPRVAEAAPEAVLTVIGKGSSRHLLRRSGNGSRIEVTGYVASLDRYLAETAAFVVPLRSGAGMRVKILDAWCWGLPVVSTTIGAEGIRTEPGQNILLADTEDAFADAVVDVMRNGPLARRLSEQGRATAEAWYDWRKVYQAWDRVYR